MRVTLPDDVLAPYDAMATIQGRPVEAVLADQLSRFSALVPGTRAVVLNDDQLTRLASALVVEQIRDAAHLTTRTEQHGAVSFEGIALRLTPAQKAELHRRADRQGRPVKALVKEMVDRVLQEMFWSTGSGEPATVAVRKAG